PHSSLNYRTPAEFAAGWRNGKIEGKQTDITNWRLCLILGAGHDNLGNGQLYSEYKAELARQRLDIPHFEKQEIKYTRVKIRPAQGVFRSRVMTNWDNRCAITGTGLALEAAHIISHASGGAPTVENGLCLAADLHTLMDRGHLLIDGNVVRLSDEAKEEPRYSGLDGTVLRKPRQPVVFPDSQ
ncbi:HNH endonuclease, partial [Atlantibacter sp. RC6]|uniref:HNH endonuclease n=1 Tax=Atlantibacter sp. RC6 TaxID=2587036 RepID=UPI00160566BF